MAELCHPFPTLLFPHRRCVNMLIKRDPNPRIQPKSFLIAGGACVMSLEVETIGM